MKTNSELLDDSFRTVEERKQVNFINWISIIILWLGIGLCAINGILGDVKVIVAIVFLIAATALSFYDYVLGVKVTLGITLIGTLNLISFFPIKQLISFGINNIAIGFEFILFGIGLIHYFTNREELREFLKDVFNSEKTEEEIIATQRSRINVFKRRFESKSVYQLELIANNRDLLPEAVQAARELLEKRNEQ